MTESPGLADKAVLGELWAANPDLVDVPIPAKFGSWNSPLIGELGPRQVLTAAGGHGNPQVDPIRTGGSVKFATEMPGETVGEATALLTPYPSLHDVEAFAEVPNAGADFGQADDQVYRNDGPNRNSRVILGRRAPGVLSHAQYWRLEDALFSFVEIDDRQPAAPHLSWIGYALPRVAGGNSPSPLMLWWSYCLGSRALSDTTRQRGRGRWTSTKSLSQCTCTESSTSPPSGYRSAC